MVSATAGLETRRGIKRLRRIDERARVCEVDPPAGKHSVRRRMVLWSLAGVAVLLAGAWFWRLHTRVVAVGIVEGEVFECTAPGSVTVQGVYVEPGQWCEKDQPLVALAARNAEAERRVLEARLRQARARLALVQHGAELEDLQVGRRLDDHDRLATEMAATEADVVAARARFEYAERELAIQASLREGGHSSVREFDAAQTQATVARAGLIRARASLAGLQQRWERQRELIPADSSGAELRQIELNLLTDAVREVEQRLQQFDFQSGTRTILAPFSGRVDRLYVESDSHREEGDPLLRVYDPMSLHITAYVKPADRDRLPIGAEVRMFPLGRSPAIVGLVREIHETWVRTPGRTQQVFGQSEVAVTAYIECDQANRALLAPGMVLKIVSRGR